MLAISLIGLAGTALWMLWPQTAAAWVAPVPLTALAAIFAAAGSVVMFLRRTTESLEFWSVHGQVTLVSVTGAIGSTRDGKKFFVELIKSIGAAKAAELVMSVSVDENGQMRQPSVDEIRQLVVT